MIRKSKLAAKRQLDFALGRIDSPSRRPEPSLGVLTIKQPPAFKDVELFPDLIPDKPITRPGEARTRYGEIVNEIVNALLGLTDIPNSGSHDIVFDAWRKGTFFEIKSLRKGSKCPVYDWRVEKDEKAGVPLLYVIGVHRCKQQKSVGDVWRVMVDTLDELYVLPASVIGRLAMAEPLQTIGSHKTSSGERNGYQRKGYKEGYRNIPWEKISKACEGGKRRTMVAQVHGLPCYAKVHFHPVVTPWSV